MDRENARKMLEDWTLLIKSNEMDTKMALKSRNYLEAQASYDDARARLAGIKATFSALEIFSNKEMDTICQNTLKRRRTVHGILSDHTGIIPIAWKATIFPLLQGFKVFFYFWIGTGIGALLFTMLPLR